jgi:hypothetical protein
MKSATVTAAKLARSSSKRAIVVAPHEMAATVMAERVSGPIVAIPSPSKRGTVAMRVKNWSHSTTSEKGGSTSNGNSSSPRAILKKAKSRISPRHSLYLSFAMVGAASLLLVGILLQLLVAVDP